jgi:FkbM family methyltransferase
MDRGPDVEHQDLPGASARRWCRRYPFLPQSNRFASLVGAYRHPPVDGAIVDTRYGVRVRVFDDAMFLRPWIFGDYEPFMTKAMSRLIRPGDVILDVGANFGWYSALFATWTGPAGRVHAFEPMPAFREMLVDTLALNRLSDRVNVNPFGLGDSDGQFTLYTFPGLTIGHASATTLGRTDATPHTCSIRRLDDVLLEKRIDRVDIVKIDVEGHEPSVIAGATNLLSRGDAPVVHFEINRNCIRDRGIDPNQIFDSLRKMGYTAFDLVSSRLGVRPVDRPLDTLSADYLATKPTHSERIRRVRGTGRWMY